MGVSDLVTRGETLCDGEDRIEAEGRGTHTGPCLSCFLPGGVGTFLKWVNFVGVRVNDIVIRAEIFFGEDGTEAEGRCTPNGADCSFYLQKALKPL